MQTNFTLAQLADADMAQAEKILRSCVHCGFCIATCPTYTLLGDERDSPRGRIYLIKDMLENDAQPPDDSHIRHIDRCLSCLSCMTTCPSGVDYMHLVDHARHHIERRGKRPLADRLLRALLGGILPRPALFRLILQAALPGRWLYALAPAGFWRGSLLSRLGAMLSLAQPPAPPSPLNRPGCYPAQGTRRRRVALLTGCIQPALAPEINDATIRLLTRLGVEVTMPAKAGCCGALNHHMGQHDAALARIKANIAAWCAEMEAAGLDAIVVNASGCGVNIKDYGFLLRNDPEWAERAARVSGLCRDISEWLLEFDPPPALTTAGGAPGGLVVAYHAACSMQHGQKLREPSKILLTRAGFTVREIPEGHLCCGSAGVYNLLQPAIATGLRDRKLANIVKTQPDIVAAGNIGCIAQLRAGARIPVLHTVELLDWAAGGNKPAGLAR